MLRRIEASLFDDSSPYLDRFGVLFVLTIAGIALLALVDQDADNGIWSVASTSALTCLTGATFLLAVRASGVARAWRVVADVIVSVGIGIAIIVFVVDLLSDADVAVFPSPARPSPEAWLWTIIAISLPAMIVRRLLHHRLVTSRTLLGGISAYLLIAVAFDFLFITLDGQGSTPFFGHPEPSTSFMYFSLSTITTLGLGDLAAVTDLGRLLSVSEAVIGQVFLVTFLAMVVGLMGQRLAIAGVAPANLPPPEAEPPAAAPDVAQDAAPATVGSADPPSTDAGPRTDGAAAED